MERTDCDVFLFMIITGLIFLVHKLPLLIQSCGAMELNGDGIRAEDMTPHK